MVGQARPWQCQSSNTAGEVTNSATLSAFTNPTRGALPGTAAGV